MLVYPLNLITRPEEIRKDLEYYEDKIDKTGPAMSFSVLALQYARLAKAIKLMNCLCKVSVLIQLLQFGVNFRGCRRYESLFCNWCGRTFTNCYNGFCGLEVTDNGIKQLFSKLPKHWKKLTITGVGPDRKTYVRMQK